MCTPHSLVREMRAALPYRTVCGARSERAVKVKDQTATNNSGDLEEYSQACSLQRAVKTAKGQDRDRGESIHTCGPDWEPQTADYEKPVNRALLHFYQIHQTHFGTSLHADSNLICVDPESYCIPGCVLKVCAEQLACVFIFHTSRLLSVVLSTTFISFRFLEVYLTLDLSWTLCINISVYSVRRSVRLFFLYRAIRLKMDSRIFCSFYRCTLKRILTGSITAWDGSCSALSGPSPQSLIKAAYHMEWAAVQRGVVHPRCGQSVYSRHTPPQSCSTSLDRLWLLSSLGKNI